MWNALGRMFANGSHDDAGSLSDAIPPNRREKRFITWCFAIVVASWLIVPLMFRHGTAPDSTAYVAAINQVHANPDVLYAAHAAHWHDVTPAFRQTWCETAQVATCQGSAYLSAPLALPLVWAVTANGQRFGIDIFRVLAGLCLIASMGFIWKRLAGRSRHAAAMLTVSAVFLTPLAYKTVAIGQTSPLLLLSVSIGLVASPRPRSIAAALSWVAGVAFKTSPVVVGAVLLVRRRWRDVVAAGVALGVLVLGSLVIAPASLWSNYLNSSRGLSDAAGSIAHNASIVTLIPGSFGSSIAQLIAVACAAAFCVLTMRHKSDDSLWALAHVAWLLIAPLIWSHYLWVGFGAVCVLLAARHDATDQQLLMLPIVAAMIGAPVTFGAENVFHDLSIPLPVSAAVWDVYRPLSVVSIAAVCAVLARQCDGVRSARTNERV